MPARIATYFLQVPHSKRYERRDQAFSLLQKASIHARYKDSFEVKGEEAVVLLERVNVLLEKIGEEFERITNAFDDSSKVLLAY